MRTALSVQAQLKRGFALWLIAALSLPISAIALAQPAMTLPSQPAPAAQAPVVSSNAQAQAAAPTTATAASTAAAAQPAAKPAPIVPPKSPIIHSISFEPAAHALVVKSVFPTGGRDAVDLMMSVWTPGFYRIENYAAKVKNFVAASPSGEVLKFEKPADNRWRIAAPGEAAVVVAYRLECVPDPSQQRPNREFAGSVSQSVVNPEYAVICPGPTYLTLVGELDRPHEVRLNMPVEWAKSATGLGPASDSYAHHFLAKDFDTLMDSPIAAGNLTIHDFSVDGSRHHLVDIGNAIDRANWLGSKKIADLEKMVQETRNFWGTLPFDDYYFLNKITSGGGGGLEHLNSQLIHTAPPARLVEGRATHLRWINFVAHEYFHAFNVKRLRPIELGPFDYEHARRTSGLWIAEGLTNYFNALIVARAGICTPEEYLNTLSGHIRMTQTTPGRLVQSLAASSLETWSGDGFGGNRGRDVSISYYEKGPVVGWLLDAKIRRATDNKKSLDDVMRLAYSRYSGAKGYTGQEFLDTAQEVATAAVDLTQFFNKNLFSTEELDYTEALDWFGLQFAASEGDGRWQLQVLPNATDAQKEHLATYLASSKAAVAVAAKTEPKPPKVMKVEETVKPTPLIDGIGGVFMFSTDPQRLAEWYQKSLGLEAARQGDGAFVLTFNYRKDDNPNAKTKTVWAILPATEDKPAGTPPFQINYRVPDMGQMISHLRAGGIQIEKAENYPWGRFAWLRDPDGNRVELFQPMD